jgi:hypothetical protein
VELVAYPYDVPSTNTTKIDQYTGEVTVITTPGYHVDNRTIEVVIKNQRFTPYTDADDNEIKLYYKIQLKGHFGEDWEEASGNIEQSSSNFTVFSIAADYPNGSQIDFQVKAILGHYYTAFSPPGHAIAFPYGAFQVDEDSGWSNTQTLALIFNDDIPEFPSWTILPLLVTATLAALTYRKRMHNTRQSGRS